MAAPVTRLAQLHADKYSHFLKNKSNFPDTNKYGWCRLLNCRATPEAGASWSQDLEIILRNWTRATLQASRKF